MNYYKNHKINLEILVARFPKQFSMEQNIGFSWPDGWHHLVAEVCEQIDSNAPDLKWVQIKEKFAGLRMYYSDGPMFLDNVSTMTTMVRTEGTTPDVAIAQPIIDAVARKSMVTCMGCGETGSRKIESGIVFTACDSCFAADGGGTDSYV